MGVRIKSLIDFLHSNIDELEENLVSVIEASPNSASVQLQEFGTKISLVKEGEFFVASSLLADLENTKHLSVTLINLMKLHGLNLGVRTFLEENSKIGIIADDFSHDFNIEELCTWLYQFQFIANIALSIISISNSSGEILSQSDIESLFDEAN